MMISLEYEMELGQSHDQPDEDFDDEPPAKKMRYGDAELDSGRDHRTNIWDNIFRREMIGPWIPDKRHVQRSSKIIRFLLWQKILSVVIGENE